MKSSELMFLQDKVAWYEKMEFKNLGPSGVEFGSGGWYDMVKQRKSFIIIFILTVIGSRNRKS